MKEVTPQSEKKRKGTTFKRCQIKIIYPQRHNGTKNGFHKRVRKDPKIAQKNMPFYRESFSNVDDKIIRQISDETSIYLSYISYVNYLDVKD